jgi:hypothetical protein
MLDLRLRDSSTSLQFAAAAAALWLIAAPALLDFDGAARTNDRIAGPIALTFAFVGAWEILRGVRLVNVAVGAWLLIAPWMLRYDANAAIVSDTVVGVALIVGALLAGETSAQFSGGWRSLRNGSHRLRTDDEKP